jgi:hypothetical protein
MVPFRQPGMRRHSKPSCSSSIIHEQFFGDPNSAPRQCTYPRYGSFQNASGAGPRGLWRRPGHLASHSSYGSPKPTTRVSMFAVAMSRFLVRYGL